MSGVYNTSRSQLIFNMQNKKLCFQRLTDSQNRTLEKNIIPLHHAKHDGDTDSLTIHPILSMTYIPKTGG